MTCRIAAMLLVVCLTPMAPAVNPRDKPATGPERAEAYRYARALLSITATIQQQYFRPVSEIDLIEAALSGLYDHARLRIPVALRKDLERAEKESELIEFVASIRRAVGDENLPGDTDLFASLKAFTEVLDPHSVVTKEDTQYRGTIDAPSLGIELAGDPTPRGYVDGMSSMRQVERFLPVPCQISVVKPGSPAQRAGLKPGDVITHLNGRLIDAETASWDYEQIAGFGPKTNNDFELVVLQKGRTEPSRMKLSREVFRTEAVFGVLRLKHNSWDYWLDPKEKLAYVRLGFIDTHVPEQLASVLAILEREQMRGLILDLRWCPGGYLNSSAAIAAMFVKEGLIAEVKYRSVERRSQTVFRADDTTAMRFKSGDYPIVALVNGETSGGGEMIAAVLQDHGRGIIAGQRTIGKGSIQFPISPPPVNGWGFKLSGGMFTRPSGKNLQRFPDSKSTDDWGIRPDRGRELPMTADLSKALKEELLLFTLRPGSSREAMAFDDPEYDTQRVAAERMLREALRK